MIIVPHLETVVRPSVHAMRPYRLTPGVKYYYTFGTEGSGGYSEEQYFIAPPTPGPNVTTKILAYGGKCVP